MAFKDLFIKSEEIEKTVEVKEQPQVKKQEETVVQPTPPVVMKSTQQSSISANEEIIGKLWKKIIDSNRPGPDYLELKNNVEALEDLQISPEQKLTTAFKILKKSYPNFTKDDIIQAIDFYINLIEGEKNCGLIEFESLVSKKITGVEDEIKSMQKKLEELKQQYDELQKLIGEKTIELTETKNDIDLKHKAFISSIDAVIGVLNSDKNQINSINL